MSQERPDFSFPKGGLIIVRPLYLERQHWINLGTYHKAAGVSSRSNTDNETIPMQTPVYICQLNQMCPNVSAWSAVSG